MNDAKDGAVFTAEPLRRGGQGALDFPPKKNPRAVSCGLGGFCALKGEPKKSALLPAAAVGGNACRSGSHQQRGM